MNISAINGSNSFGRAIIINSKSIDDFEKRNKELEKVLNGYSSNLYPKKEARKIRKFFRSILGDYDTSHVKIIKNKYKDTILLSGQEYKKWRDLDRERRKITYGIFQSEKMSDVQKHKLVKDAYSDMDLYLNTVTEDGRNNKTDSRINLFSKDGKISRVDYSSMLVKYADYGDGHKLNDDEDKSSMICSRRMSSVDYEEKSLNLTA